MGIELELAVLLLLQMLGSIIFAPFEIETPAWRKILKWLTLDAVTIGLSFWIGHWALLFPALILVLGSVVHFNFCQKNGIHPLKATPRKKYYELRGWKWVD